MIFVQQSQSKSITVELDQRADATPTFTCYGPAGSTVQASASVTMHTTTTTLSGAAAAGATTVSVTSATGIVAGERYLIGGHEDVGGEWITCLSIAATTVTLLRPLIRAKASGAAFQSTRVICALTGSNFANVDRHYRIAIAWAVSTVAQTDWVVPFDVVRYDPRTGLSLARLRDLDPVVAKRMPEGTWWPDLRDLTWNMVLTRIAQKVDPGAIVGAVDLTTPHAYMTLAHLLERDTRDEWMKVRDRMSQRMNEELDAALVSHAIDNDQDGAIESNEGAYRGIALVRA